VGSTGDGVVGALNADGVACFPMATVATPATPATIRAMGLALPHVAPRARNA